MNGFRPFPFDPPARTEPASLIVLHWTAGIGDPAQVARTLAARRLSIHFTIGVGGEVVQQAPLKARCAHAGTPVNGRSIGIEVVSPGLPGPVHDREWARGVRRDTYTAQIKGARRTMLDYTPAQATAVADLCKGLTYAFDIPRRVPTDPAGRLITRQLTPAELAAFSGVIGHYHCHRSKLDPGTRPLERLLALGWR